MGFDITSLIAACRQRYLFSNRMTRQVRSSPLVEGWGCYKQKQLCFLLGKHGWLPIETLSLYFRELPKLLENNVFPLQPPWATEGVGGGRGRTASSWVEAGFLASEFAFQRFCGGLQLLACLSFWNSRSFWFRSGNFPPWKVLRMSFSNVPSEARSLPLTDGN